MTKDRYGIYNVRLNGDTMNFGGLEWVVDGEIGRMVYPGTWAECTVRQYYANGWKYNDERARQKKGVKYYSLRRPVEPGSYPKTRKVLNIANFDQREYVPEIERQAWGYIEYDGELDEKSAYNYELVRERV